MEFSKAAVGGLAALCIAGGAGGAYLATRGSGLARPATETGVAVASPDPLALTGEPSTAIGDDKAPVAGSVTASPTPARRAAPRRPAAPREQAQVTSARPEPVPEVDSQPPSAPSIETRNVSLPVPEPERPSEPEPVRPAEPATPEFEELIVSADSVIGLQVETSMTSERARVEDEVVARVTRDVRVGDRIAIPAGARARGEVTLVERGDRLRGRARLGVRFTSVTLADGTRIPLDTDTIYREGDAPSRESAAKIGGGAIGGAIIGGIFGGAKGAVIGGSAGAGAGTAAVLAGGRNPATLPAGTPITVRVIKPTTVTVER